MRVRRLLAGAVPALTALGTVGAVGMAPAAAVADGVAAEEGQFPYAVKLVLTGIPTGDGGTRDSACSGALISPTWVITAGHCFHDGTGRRISGAPAYTATARLGTPSTTDPSAGVTRTVEHVEQSGRNDIAVARLDAPVDTVAPVQLSTRKPARGQVLAVAGWGATSSDGPPSDQLHWGRVTVSTVRTTTVLVKGTFPAPDTSACPYDSGAPYLVEGTTPVLVSVENNGPDCPHSSQETTARVDVVADWVRAVTGLA